MPSKVSSAPKSVSAQPAFEFPGQSADTRPYWSAVAASARNALVDAWTDAGGAVLFGWTKDGTALNLSLWMGEGKANYTYGQPIAAENACLEYAEWARDWKARALKMNNQG